MQAVHRGGALTIHSLGCLPHCAVAHRSRSPPAAASPFLVVCAVSSLLSSLPLSSLLSPSMSAAAASAAAATPKAGSDVLQLHWVNTAIPQRKNKVALITGITGQGQLHKHERERKQEKAQREGRRNRRRRCALLQRRSNASKNLLSPAHVFS